MVFLLPISNRTTERLRAMPEEGGTHRWLVQVAGGLCHVLDADTCFAFLRRCCDEAVAHRTVADAGIAAAVDFAYSGRPVARINFGRQPEDWPEPRAVWCQRRARALGEETAQLRRTHRRTNASGARSARGDG
jgi:hypothetical protein